jgi:hypothetical protein
MMMFWSRKRRERDAATVEFIYAADAAVRYNLFEMNNGMTLCVCGAQCSHIAEPSGHGKGCPAVRYFRALDRVQQAVK